MRKLGKLLILISLVFAFSSNVFCYSVFAADDVTQLQLAHDSAESAINTQEAPPLGDPYEANSYQAFIDTINGLGGLVGIQAIIDNPASLQTDVNILTIDINNALSSLILDDTYYTILAQFSTANSIDLNPYTSDSQTLYNNEMDRIEIILNTPTAGEITIQDLSTDITNASDLLILRGNKTDMNDLIIQIETLYGIVGDDYIPSTFSSFKSSYDAIDVLLVADVGMSLQEIEDDIDSTVLEVQAAEIRLNEVLDILVLRPDKSQLQSDYAIALAVDSNLYTTSTFVSFTNGLELIEAVIDDLEALDTDVVQASSDLANLYSVLVLIGDVASLQTAYNLALSQDLSSFTPNSVANYQNELSRINDIILSDNTDQIAADQASQDLIAAEDLLILQADRSNLDILNNLLIDAYYEESQLYTASSHSTFRAACAVFGSYLYTNSVIVDDNVTQASVNALESSIQAALELLVPLVDNSGLLLVYYELRAIDLSNYTTNSQISYEDELDRLHLIIIGAELDSISVSEVMIDLSELDNILIELADYTELQATYDSMHIYREEDYSVSSFSILKASLVYAENMLSNLNASQTELDTTIEMLNDSVESLQQFIEPIYLRENKTEDIMQYVTLGQSTVVDFEVGDSTIITVDSTGLIQGVGYGETYVTVNLSNGAEEVIEVIVLASIKLPVYIMTFTIPVATIGLGSLVLFGRKETWIKFVSNIKNIFKKKQ
jgi:hypothetical protein